MLTVKSAAFAGLEIIGLTQLLPEPMAAEARRELSEIREGILRLMDGPSGRA